MVPAHKQTQISIYQFSWFRYKPILIWSTNMIKEERLYNGGKDSLFSNGVEKTGCLCAKESHWTILPPYKKNMLNID